MTVDDPKDLDHSDDRSEYLGLSHAWCNRAKRPRTRRERHPCPICGDRVKPGNRTCSRACSNEWRRRAA